MPATMRVNAICSEPWPFSRPNSAMSTRTPPWRSIYLGSLYRKEGDFEAARPLLVAAADTLQAQKEVDHPYLLRVQRELATTWAGLGRFAAAESLFGLTLDRELQREGEPNLAVAITLLFQGDMFRTRGDMDRALACYREVDRIANDLFPDTDHFLKAMAQHQLALDAAARGDLAGARRAARGLASTNAAGYCAPRIRGSSGRSPTWPAYFCARRRSPRPGRWPRSTSRPHARNTGRTTRKPASPRSSTGISVGRRASPRLQTAGRNGSPERPQRRRCRPMAH